MTRSPTHPATTTTANVPRRSHHSYRGGGDHHAPPPPPPPQGNLETINEDVEMTSAHHHHHHHHHSAASSTSSSSSFLEAQSSPSSLVRRRRALRRRPPPRAYILTHLLAASVMTIASFAVGTFWRARPLPLCLRHWVLVGEDEGRCYWRPSGAVLLAACAAYAAAAAWWCRRHGRWRYGRRTVAAIVLLGVCASSFFGTAFEDVLRNVLPWSAFGGLVAVGVLDHFFAGEGGVERVA